MQGDSINTHLGQKMRQRRWILGMTQEQLGRAIGVRFQQIQKYESGRTQISASRLLQISAALGCSITYFFEEVDAG